MSKRIDFREIKQRISMEEVLSHYGLRSKLAGKGDQLRGSNPFDPDSDNPSRFSVSLKKNCWHVFGTELSGNVIDFVKEMEQVSLVDAARKLNEWFPVRMDSDGDNSVADAKEPAVLVSQDDEREESGESPRNLPLSFELKQLDSRHAYLKERNLSAETIQNFGIGYASRGILKGRIAIPVRNVCGELVAYIGRYPGDPPEGVSRYLLPKGFMKGLELFNFSSVIADPEDTLIIVEGAFDCFRLWQLGCPSVVALLGSSLSSEQSNLLKDYWRGRLLLLLDDDQAGKDGCERALPILAKNHWVKVGQFPQGVEQPENLSKEHLGIIGL